MMRAYEVTACWDGRSTSVHEYAAALLELTKALGATDARLLRWHLLEDPNAVSRAEEIEKALLLGVTTWEHGSTHYRAYEVSLENEAPEGGRVALDALVGIDRPPESIRFPNRVGLTFWGPGARDGFRDPAIVFPWLDAVTKLFSPAWVCVAPRGVFGDHYEEVVDGKPPVSWMVYLAAEYGTVAAPPAPSVVKKLEWWAPGDCRARLVRSGEPQARRCVRSDEAIARRPGSPADARGAGSRLSRRSGRGDLGRRRRHRREQERPRLLGVLALRREPQVRAEVLVLRQGIGVRVAEERGQRVVGLRALGPVPEHGLERHARGIGLADAGVERAEEIAKLGVGRVLSRVVLGVGDGRAVAVVGDAHLKEERQRLARVGAGVERRGEVLLGAREVGDAGERFSAGEELVWRLLALHRLHLHGHAGVAAARCGARGDREEDEEGRGAHAAIVCGVDIFGQPHVTGEAALCTRFTWPTLGMRWR